MNKRLFLALSLLINLPVLSIEENKDNEETKKETTYFMARLGLASGAFLSVPNIVINLAKYRKSTRRLYGIVDTVIQPLYHCLDRLPSNSYEAYSQYIKPGRNLLKTLFWTGCLAGCIYGAKKISKKIDKPNNKVEKK